MNLSLGLAYTILQEPENSKGTGDNFLFPTYSYTYNELYTASMLINPKIEFPFTRIYGLTISPMVQLNPIRTYYGIGIGQMIGLVRSKLEK